MTDMTPWNEVVKAAWDTAQAGRQSAALEALIARAATPPADPELSVILHISAVHGQHAATLPLAAWLTVDNAVGIATRWNVPEEIIGLTIVAIGTSLPELATSVQAARHGNSSVAIGNVIGSNLFNIAAIMGITAAVAGPVPVASHVVSFDI